MLLFPYVYYFQSYSDAIRYVEGLHGDVLHMGRIARIQTTVPTFWRRGLHIHNFVELLLVFSHRTPRHGRIWLHKEEQRWLPKGLVQLKSSPHLL